MAHFNRVLTSFHPSNEVPLAALARDHYWLGALIAALCHD
jgi:hypothetical protein